MPLYGVIAQLVERYNGIVEVKGSTPFGSTIDNLDSFIHLADVFLKNFLHFWENVVKCDRCWQETIMDTIYNAPSGGMGTGLYVLRELGVAFGHVLLCRYRDRSICIRGYDDRVP